MKKKTKKKLLRNINRHKIPISIAALAVLLCLAMLANALLHPAPTGVKRLVTVYDRGKKIVVLTRANTVQGALNAADIRVDPHDIVDPVAATRLHSKYEDVIIYRSRLVGVIDGSVRQTVLTVSQSPNLILKDAKMEPLGSKDKTTFKPGDLATNGTSTVLVIERVEQPVVKPQRVAFTPRPDALTVSKGAQVFVDSAGVAHRETYYDLPMNVAIGTCGAGASYTIRSDGAKIDQNGYVLVAANLGAYPRCSVVETSLGLGKVYDTGGFALRYPYGFDLATDWTNYNGR